MSLTNPFKYEEMAISYMKKDIIVFLIMISILIASGCESTPSNSTTTTTTTPAPAPSTAILTNHTPTMIGVTMQNSAFNPTTLTILTGDTVRWTNLDDAQHNVKGDTFNSSVLPKNGTFDFTFSQPGTHDYICTIHPSMHGQIVVQ